MINFKEALAIVQRHLRQIETKKRSSGESALSLEILEEKTLEEDFGWVFFYNSAKYIETRNPSFLLAGNAPIIVEKETGNVIETGTAHDIEYYLAQYKRQKT